MIFFLIKKVFLENIFQLFFFFFFCFMITVLKNNYINMKNDKKNKVIYIKVILKKHKKGFKIFNAPNRFLFCKTLENSFKKMF